MGKEVDVRHVSVCVCVCAFMYTAFQNMQFINVSVLFIVLYIFSLYFTALIRLFCCVCGNFLSFPLCVCVHLHRVLVCLLNSILYMSGVCVCVHAFQIVSICNSYFRILYAS